MKRVVSGMLVSTACVLLVSGCAGRDKTEAQAAPVAAATPISGTIGENTVTVTATVEKIDLKKRRVTLRGPQGKVSTIDVSDRVKNLAQVKVGDQVVATYYESAAYEVKKPGEAAPGVSVASDSTSAKPGERPAGVEAQAIKVTSTIEAIDKQAQTVTLKGPEGDSVTVKVRRPERLDQVKVGDLVEITYTQALAISVESASK